MKRNYILTIFLVLSCFPGISQTIDYNKIELIINAFSSDSPELIANYIEYPLKRRYPLPEIKNKQEFINNFFELFDKSFIQAVGSSNSQKDWNEIGWRGIMYNNGELWLSENYKIRTINYESILGKIKKEEIIYNQKKKLPLIYQEIDNPIYEWNSEKYHYRLDEIKKSYRLLVWNINQTELLNVYNYGKWEPDGNMGYFHIDWNVKDKVIRIQNYGRNDEWLYHYLIYNEKDLFNNEEAKEEYVDIEIR